MSGPSSISTPSSSVLMGPLALLLLFSVGPLHAISVRKGAFAKGLHSIRTVHALGQIHQAKLCFSAPAEDICVSEDTEKIQSPPRYSLLQRYGPWYIEDEQFLRDVIDRGLIDGW